MTALQVISGLPGSTRMTSSPPRSCTWISCPQQGEPPARSEPPRWRRCRCRRPSLAAAAFPHPHLQVGGIHHLHELGVDALREVGVMLERRAAWLPASGCPHPPPRSRSRATLDAGHLPHFSLYGERLIHQRAFAHVDGRQVGRQGAVKRPSPPATAVRPAG